jgi:hypothetical protein
MQESETAITGFRVIQLMGFALTRAKERYARTGIDTQNAAMEATSMRNRRRYLPHGRRYGVQICSCIAGRIDA